MLQKKCQKQITEIPIEKYFEVPSAAEKQKEVAEAKLLKSSGKDGKKKTYEPAQEEIEQLEEIYGERNETNE